MFVSVLWPKFFVHILRTWYAQGKKHQGNCNGFDVTMIQDENRSTINVLCGYFVAINTGAQYFKSFADSLSITVCDKEKKRKKRRKLNLFRNFSRV